MVALEARLSVNFRVCLRGESHIKGRSDGVLVFHPQSENGHGDEGSERGGEPASIKTIRSRTAYMFRPLPEGG